MVSASESGRESGKETTGVDSGRQKNDAEAVAGGSDEKARLISHEELWVAKRPMVLRTNHQLRLYPVR